MTYLTMMLQAYVSNTVGMYSLGNASVAYTIRRHVLPTAPSPTTTHLMVCTAVLMLRLLLCLSHTQSSVGDRKLLLCIY